MFNLVAGALMSVALSSFVAWFRRKLYSQRGVVIETVIERGPVSREYGFTESAVKATFNNASRATIGIRDVRIFLTGGFGVPVPPQAPPLRHHEHLPATIGTGTSSSWYFPAESLSYLVRDLATPRRSKNGVVRVRVLFTEINGRIYKGPWFELSLDPNSHWSL